MPSAQDDLVVLADKVIVADILRKEMLTSAQLIQNDPERPDIERGVYVFDRRTVGEDMLCQLGWTVCCAAFFVWNALFTHFDGGIHIAQHQRAIHTQKVTWL